MQVEKPLSSSYSPTLSKKNKEQNLLSASLNQNLNQDETQNNQFSEKTVYRSSQKFPQLKESNSYSRCSTAASFDHNLNREDDLQSRANSSRLNRTGRRHKRDADNVDWNNLGLKIEDWFNTAKTPDQRIVYKFLKDIKDEDYDRTDGASSVITTSTNVYDNKAQSLEDILDNLKKYRGKFNRSTRSGHHNSNSKSRANTSLPKLKDDFMNNNYKDINKNINKSDLNNQIFESSTWRVMRHLKSADIRNKYPLPKANPEHHFRNATIFHTCGRPPKSTFLLHPDWI